MKPSTSLAVIGVILALGGIALGVNHFLSNDPTVTQSAKRAPVTAPQGAPEIAPEGPYPKAVVSEYVHNFNVMVVGATKSHTFVITNEGEAPLELFQGQTTCKCTMSEMAQDKIPPGESAEIELSWTPKGPQEQFSQSAAIWTNDPDNQEITLEITGMVDARINLSPEAPWDLGILSLNKPFKLDGYLYTRISEDFEITGHEVKNPDIKVSWEPMTENKKQEFGALAGYHLTLEGKMTWQEDNQKSPGKESVQKVKTIGSYQTQIKLKTNTKEHPELKFDLSGRVKGPLEVRLLSKGTWIHSNLTYIMGSVDSKQGTQRELVVDFSELEDLAGFEIEKVVTSPEVIQVRFEENKDFISNNQRRFKMIIEIPPDSPRFSLPADKPGVITVHTNHTHPLLKSFEIKLQAVVR